MVRCCLLGERLAKLQTVKASATVLDALLDITQLNHFPVLPEAEGTDPSLVPDKAAWQVERRPGWLVPLPVGYAGISPLYAPGEVANARDDAIPFRFVESLISLGQWISPHRLTSLKQLLWHYQNDPQAGLYRTLNHYADSLAATVTPVSASQGA